MKAFFFQMSITYQFTIVKVLGPIIKLGRLGTRNDVASLVSFMASKGSDYMTGQTISTDGGMFIG